jgi:hypothetical protein
MFVCSRVPCLPTRGSLVDGGVYCIVWVPTGVVRSAVQVRFDSPSLHVMTLDGATCRKRAVVGCPGNHSVIFVVQRGGPIPKPLFHDSPDPCILILSNTASSATRYSPRLSPLRNTDAAACRARNNSSPPDACPTHNKTQQHLQRLDAITTATSQWPTQHSRGSKTFPRNGYRRARRHQLRALQPVLQPRRHRRACHQNHGAAFPA